MRATFLGFTLPEGIYRDVAATDPILPAQTQNFAWSFVGALREGGMESVNLVSAAPVSSFPRNPRVLWKCSRFKERGLSGMMLPFVNLPVAKHVTRFLSCWMVGTGFIRRHKSDWLVVHGVHSPYLWFAVALRWRTSIRICAVLTDPPGVVLGSDGKLASWMKRIDIRVVGAALRRFDAVISLTVPLADDFAPGVPRLIMEGIYSDVTQTPHDAPSPSRPIVVYGGSLKEEYGVGSLLRAVTGSDLDVELRVFGNGPAESLVRAAASIDPRVALPEVLSKTELMARYKSATVLVQPRPIDQPFVPYSFPSKLIEYMGTGTVVVSTRLPAIPLQYEPFVIWAPTDDEEGIRAALEEVLSLTQIDRDRLGAAAADFVRSSKSEEAQGQRILRLLAGVRSRR